MVKIIKHVNLPTCFVCSTSGVEVTITFSEDHKEPKTIGLCDKHYYELVDKIKITEYLKQK